MKKIGIITFYHKNYNFGGLLQAYALPRALKLYFDLNAEQIDYTYLGEYENNSRKRIRNINEFIYQTGILFFSNLERKKINRREKAFYEFMKEIKHSVEVYGGETIEESGREYNIFICGGDQIWNDYNSIINTKIFTLQFVPKKLKKISYAPSMANLDISDEFKNIFSKGLNELDAISVREKSSIPILKEMTNKPIQVVVDPVLLLQKKEWQQIARIPHIKQPYMVCYLLGDNTVQRKAVEKLAKQLKLKILTFPHILCNVVRKCDLFFGDIHDYTSGPREFIGLIQNAQLVVTDSFHASVFSMIFETPFYIFERDKVNAKNSTNRRIYDFLKEYQLDSQLVTEKELVRVSKVPEVDFSYARKHWEKRREESLEYLENALEVTRNKKEGL